MDNLDELVRFLVPISGDKKWHEANVAIRGRPRPDLEVVISYASEALFYGAKYLPPCILAIYYYQEIGHFVRSLL